MDFSIKANASFGFDPDKRVEPMMADHEVIYTIDDRSEEWNLHSCKSIKTFFTIDNGRHWFRKESVKVVKFAEDTKIIVLVFDDGHNTTINVVSSHQNIRVLEHFLNVIG